MLRLGARSLRLARSSLRIRARQDAYRHSRGLASPQRADRGADAARGDRRELAPGRCRVCRNQAELPALLGAGLERVADRRIVLPIAILVRARAGIGHVIGTPIVVLARVTIARRSRLLDKTGARSRGMGRKANQDDALPGVP